MTEPRDTMRWVRRGGALAALLIGWIFIAWQNNFHLTAPTVFVCFAYLAVVATIYNLWRTGAVAVAEADDDGDSTWAKPVGAVGELEREKRTLLKAIKEAEFDLQMGKLSKHDADEMIRVYRARAIEVIKEIDRHGHGSTGSAREQIMREVRARLELEAKSQKKGADAKSVRAEGSARAGSAKHASDTASAGPQAGSAARSDASQPALDRADRAAQPAAGDATRADSPGGEPATGTAPTKPVSPASSTGSMMDDEGMDADSTTAHEPTRDAAKEATP